MIPVTTLKDRKVALFGLGGSGFATARALIAGGADVTAWDDNPDSVAKASAEGIRTEDLHTIDWSQQALFVLSPGVPLTHPKPHWTVDLARAAGVDIVGDVELFVRERRAHAPDCPFIAITGTNGKSTTTALIAHILKSAGYDTQLGGNIGTAVLTLDPPKAGRYFVVECSSYQIDLAPTLNPSAGILLNLTPDHLDRHGTMQHYADVKERLVAGSDVAIVGIDDSHSALIADRVERAGVTVVRISRRNVVASGIYAEGTKLVQAAGGAMLPLPISTASRRCAVTTTLRTPQPPSPPALPSAFPRPRSAPALLRFPVSNTVCSLSADAAAWFSSTIPRRPMPMPRRPRFRAMIASTGLPAACRNQAASQHSRPISRASPRPI